MNKLGICLGIALFASAPLHAANTVSASANASEISVTLQDLAPEDAISPDLVWGTDVSGSVERSVSIYHAGNFEGFSSASFEDALSIDRPGGSASVAANLGAMQASVQFDQGAQGRQVNAYSSLFLDPARRSNNSTDYWGAGYNFTLTPHTSVTFSTTATISAQAFSAVGNPWADAYVVIGAGLLTFSSGDYPYVFVSQDGTTPNVMQLWGGGGSSELTVSYQNNSETPQQAYFYSELFAAAFAPAAVTPVPEPQVAAMMALGLVVLGFGARRARAARPPV